MYCIYTFICAQKRQIKGVILSQKYNTLSKEQEYVLLHKGTEPPFSGEYTDVFEEGEYVCAQCNALLYHSSAKFHSGCGWASFESSEKGAVSESLDSDLHRIEITCTNCGGHLGHIFRGEGFTAKNTRHCVNSLSLIFHKR